MSLLLSKTTLGSLTLQNRLVMAPMTRNRAIGNVPNELVALYYAQRASAGLIVTEGTSPLPNGLGYARIPGSHYMSSQRTQGVPVTSAEKAIEITYLMQLTKWLAVQPDLQYVIHPSTDPTIPNALAFQLRFEIAF